MRCVTIISDRSNFLTSLVCGEELPDGIRLPSMEYPDVAGLRRYLLQVNLRVISSTAFAMWVLRKVRSVPGNHQIEIGGRKMPILMPQAIDVLADALVQMQQPDPLAA